MQKGRPPELLKSYKLLALR